MKHDFDLRSNHDRIRDAVAYSLKSVRQHHADGGWNWCQHEREVDAVKQIPNEHIGEAAWFQSCLDGTNS